MDFMPMRVVLDTNVVFEGLTKQAGICGLIIDAWRAGLLVGCVSNALLNEYDDVLARKLSARRYAEIIKVLDELLDESTYFVRHYYTWRPMSADPGDEHVIDCAMNANAILVTFNIRDFQRASNRLGLRVMTPSEFVQLLTDIE